MQKNQKIILGATLAFVVLMGGILALVLDAFTSVPDFTQMKSGQVKVMIYLPNGERSYRWVGPEAPGWVGYRKISKYVFASIVSSEDTTFYVHKGVDYHELQEAIKKDIEEKRFARGASTLTQQVIKNAYLTRQKTLWRKLKEFLWAQALEKVLTKSEILTFYVNMVEWGPGIYGIKNAAMHYFSRLPSELSPRQGAFLAMLLPAPTKYYRYFSHRQLSKWATARVNRVLLVANSMGLIDDSEYDRGMRERLWGEPSLPTPRQDLTAPVSDEAPEADFAEQEGRGSAPESEPSESPTTAASAAPTTPTTGAPGTATAHPRTHEIEPTPHVRTYQDEPSILDMQGSSPAGSDPLDSTPAPQ